MEFRDRLDQTPAVNIGVAFDKPEAAGKNRLEAGRRPEGVDACAEIEDLLRGSPGQGRELIDVSAVNDVHVSRPKGNW